MIEFFVMEKHSNLGYKECEHKPPAKAAKSNEDYNSFLSPSLECQWGSEVMVDWSLVLPYGFSTCNDPALADNLILNKFGSARKTENKQ